MSLQERTGRALMWSGHYFMLLVLLALGNGIIADAWPRYQAPETVAALVIWPFFMTGLVANLGIHERRLCERCISAAPVLNPGKAVRRWRPVLWCFHRTAVLLVLVLVFMIWFFIDAFMPRPPLWARVTDIIATCGLVGCIFTAHQHARLLPWCPWCRWGGSGGHDVTPGVPDRPAAR